MPGCRCWKAPNTKDAFRLSIASLVITVLGIAMGLWLYGKTGSSLCLVYGLENIVDFLSSVVVLWRFFAPSTVDESLERLLNHREERASLAISIIMIVLGFFVMLASFVDLLSGSDSLEQKAAIFTLSFLTMFFFGALTILKFRYGRLLNSPSLRKDGICSLIGTALGVSLFIDTLIEVGNDKLWWLDPVVAFIAGGIAAYLGVQALHKAQAAGVNVFDRDWWYSGGEDDTPNGVEMGNANGNGTTENDELPVEPLDEDEKEVV